MKLKIIILAATFLGFVSCTKQWEDHYDTYAETVNQNVWDVLQNKPEVSVFVQTLIDFKYDTLFKSDISYSVFAPTNEAMAGYKMENTVDTMLLNYLVTSHFVQSGSIQGKRKIQMLGTKFALFEQNGSEIKFDGIKLLEESPLYNNGKYYIMDEVAEPKSNLYEYFRTSNPVLKAYIDSQDSIILDKERSTPIGFDENGNTIYDTVSIIYNKFEEEFFPVSKEFRNKTATIVFPRELDYQAALTVMAQDLNIPGYNDYNDIPILWQNNVLVPHLLVQGVFQNMLEPDVFEWKSARDTAKVKNILGDSIPIFYTPVDKAICSNGYTYNYDNFTIIDTLYKGTEKIEAELFTDEAGIDRYSWNERVVVTSDQSFQPKQEYIAAASNDSIVRALFPKGYKGKYSVEFETGYLFPRKYAMVVTTHMDIGGIYDIYVNDELVKTFDYYDFVQYQGLIFSVIPGVRYFPAGRFNKFDFWIENIHEYSKAKIRFEYKSPGFTPQNGFVLDYVSFIPADN
jgi:hypothetical protein